MLKGESEGEGTGRRRGDLSGTRKVREGCVGVPGWEGDRGRPTVFSSLLARGVDVRLFVFSSLYFASGRSRPLVGRW